MRNRGMTAALWILVSSVTMTGTVRAECVPSPDCASIGYTATSCDGGFVRCPFDTSKLFCIPCDSSYQYTCTQTGQKGKGSSCDGKYIECECKEAPQDVQGAPGQCVRIAIMDSRRLSIIAIRDVGVILKFPRRNLSPFCGVPPRQEGLSLTGTSVW